MLILYWVEYTPTLGFNTGVQRVTRMLGRALLEQGVHIIPVVWSEQLKAPILASNEDRKALQQWNGPDFGEINSIEASARQLVPPNFRGPIWLLVPEVTHLTRHRQDVTRRLIEYARGQGIRTAFLFYDALLVKWAMYESLRQPHELYMLELANADLVLPISRHAAEQLSTWWAARAERKAKAEVIPCPLAAEFPGVERITKAATDADQDVHIISVGPIDRRKNQQALIRAVERLPQKKSDKHVLLNLLGAGHPPDLQTSLGPKVRIRSLGAITEDQLVSLYNKCTFTVFPSLDEGFGLPIAESLWFGKPCVCAGFGSMGEIASGGGCLTVDPRNVEQLSRAVTRLIAEPQLRQKLAEEACARSLHTWSDYSGSVLNCLHQRQ